MKFDIPEIIYKLPKNSYIVGGAIRDFVMGRIPTDIDITTEATPAELLPLFPDANIMGVRFGTIIVDGVEITTMRKDMTSGRHPNVAFTTDLYEDLSRRDFTMNAMAIPLHGKHSVCDIIDPYFGRVHIKNQEIVSVGDATRRIAEDPLRAMRAIRFASTMNMYIHLDIMDAIKSTSLGEISAERIHDELLKALSGNSVLAVNAMKDSGLLRQILPEVLQLEDCEHSIKWHPEGNAYQHTLHALKYANDNDYSPIEKMAVLLHDVGKGSANTHYSGMLYPGHAEDSYIMSKEIMNRLKFSNEDTNGLLFAVKNHMKMHGIVDIRKSKRYTLYDNKYFDTLLKVHDADCSDRRDSHVDFVMDDIENRPIILAPLVTGHDMMEIGYEGGEYLGMIMKEINVEHVEGRINTKEEALALARQWI